MRVFTFRQIERRNSVLALVAAPSLALIGAFQYVISNGGVEDSIANNMFKTARAFFDEGIGYILGDKERYTRGVLERVELSKEFENLQKQRGERYY